MAAPVSSYSPDSASIILLAPAHSQHWRGCRTVIEDGAARRLSLGLRQLSHAMLGDEIGRIGNLKAVLESKVWQVLMMSELK